MYLALAIALGGYRGTLPPMRVYHFAFVLTLPLMAAGCDKLLQKSSDGPVVTPTALPVVAVATTAAAAVESSDVPAIAGSGTAVHLGKKVIKDGGADSSAAAIPTPTPKTDAGPAPGLPKGLPAVPPGLASALATLKIPSGLPPIPAPPK
jgi:hypothetical protein